MKILHTADWHLGDRLGRIDRTEDLRRAVERVAGYCSEHRVDVLLVAGDLFSELARPDGLRDAIRHVQETFAGFLRDGGTILALTGNHDNESFCQTLCHAMSLAAPTSGEPGATAAPGRLYLAAQPAFLRLVDRGTEHAVQFILMPYPTPTRYLDAEETQRYSSLEEKNRHLQTAYTATLRAIRAHPRFDRSLPTVLGAHVHVRGGQVSTLFRISEQEDVVFEDEDLPTDFAYVALGHIHKPQALGGHAHVRYSGSIERMDLGESGDNKSVVLFEVGPGGRTGEPVCLPLEATPVHEVVVLNPHEELPQLSTLYPDAARALVHIKLTYTAGVDNLEETLRELEKIFPRWYARDWTESGALGPSLVIGEAGHGKSFEDTVRDYLNRELINHPDEERQAVLARAEELMREEPA
jgi:exonuclease SbcD